MPNCWCEVNKLSTELVTGFSEYKSLVTLTLTGGVEAKLGDWSLRLKADYLGLWDKERRQYGEAVLSRLCYPGERSSKAAW